MLFRSTLPEEEEKRGFHIYLASSGDDIVGKVNLHFLDHEVGIYGLGIKPEFRGQGLGKQLLRKSLSIIKAEGSQRAMLQVEAENDTALNLYIKSGFKLRSTMKYFTFSHSDVL